MGSVRQNLIQRTVRTAHLSVFMTVPKFSTQYSTESSDNLPSYLQTIIIAQMLSIGGEGGGVPICHTGPSYFQPWHYTVIHNSLILSVMMTAPTCGVFGREKER